MQFVKSEFVTLLNAHALLTRETGLREKLRDLCITQHIRFQLDSLERSSHRIYDFRAHQGELPKRSRRQPSTSAVLWKNEAKVSLKFDLSSNLFPFSFCLVKSQTLACGTEASLLCKSLTAALSVLVSCTDASVRDLHCLRRPWILPSMSANA